MTEKEMKKRNRLIVRIVIIVVFVAIAIWVTLLFLPKKEAAISDYLQDIQGQLQNDPENKELQKHFVQSVIRDQERIAPFPDKNRAIIVMARDIAKKIVEKEDDLLTSLILARLEMQISGIANSKADIVAATFGVRDATTVFDGLFEKHQDSLLYRMYRAVNYSAVPRLFGKGDEAVMDFQYVAEAVLADGFQIHDEFEDAYFKGLTQACLEMGIVYFNQENVDSTRLEEALVKIVAQLN